VVDHFGELREGDRYFVGRHFCFFSLLDFHGGRCSRVHVSGNVYLSGLLESSGSGLY
jgi:hypothetical protein